MWSNLLGEKLYALCNDPLLKFKKIILRPQELTVRVKNLLELNFLRGHQKEMLWKLKLLQERESHNEGLIKQTNENMQKQEMVLTLCNEKRTSLCVPILFKAGSTYNRNFNEISCLVKKIRREFGLFFSIPSTKFRRNSYSK